MKAAWSPRRGLWLLLAAVAAATLVQQACQSASRQADAAGHWLVQAAPRPIPDLGFVDGAGKPTRLDDFRGKVVLLNVWATWCAPCRREMPSLDRLQQRLAAEPLAVVALSIDVGPEATGLVRRFYDSLGLRALALYNDGEGQAGFRLGAAGVPSTLLLDREGRELARTIGPVDWDDPRALAFVRKQLSPLNPADRGR